MGRPLKIKYSGATAIGYQEMTDADIDYIAHNVGVAIAAVPQGYDLTVTYNSYVSGAANIGSFIDTYRPNTVGSHPVGTTINSTTNNFYQYLPSVSWSGTRYLEQVTNNSEAFDTTMVLSGISIDASGAYIKTGGANNSWDAQAYSTYGLANGCSAIARATSTSTHVMFGLNSDPGTNASYSSIDYAFYLDTSANIAIYENGSYVGAFGTYDTNSLFEIIHDPVDNYIRYYYNGTLKRSIAGPVAGTKLYFDSSFYETGSGLKNVNFKKAAWMREQNDSAMHQTIFNRVLTHLASGKVGAYYLQPTAPATGSWVNVGTVTDTAQSGNSTTYLWRCTASTAPSVVRPIFASGQNTAESNDATMQGLRDSYTQYVKNYGPGQYRVQASAPTTGTWVRMGSAFSDTIQQVSNLSYTGSYAASYSSTYSAGYASTYAAGYGGYYSASYTGSYARSYAGVIYGYYSGSYAGSRLKYFSGSRTYYYAGSRTYYYAGARDHTYTGLTVVSTKDSPSNVSLWLRTA